MKTRLRAATAALILALCGPVAAQNSATDERGQPLVQAGRAISGTLSATAPNDGKTIGLRGPYNATFTLSGLGVGIYAKYAVERSFDQGASWALVKELGGGGLTDGSSQVSDQQNYPYLFFSPTSTIAYSLTLNEPEAGVFYRVRDNGSSAGVTVTYRLSQ